MKSHSLYVTTLLAVAALALLSPSGATAAGDESFFFSSGSGRPNILILLDSSGSMKKPPSGCATDPTQCGRKRDQAGQAIRDLVTTVNPPDGAGGFINNARFGFSIFTKDGARLLVPIGEDTVGEIVDWVTNPDIPTAADTLNSLGGNSHGLAIMDSARYFAHPNSFGPFPPFGFADSSFTGSYSGNADPVDFPFEDPAVPTTWDIACRSNYLIHVDDGLWHGDDGARFGMCSDLDSDGQNETCPLEYVGDMSGDGVFWMEDVTQKMFEHDFVPTLPGTQNVVTHVITFDAPEAAELMRITAMAGGGSFQFANSGASLRDALFDITVTIFEGTASFSSVAVPSSRTSFSGYLYNAFFEPDSTTSIWEGHLESYGLATDGTILDKDGGPATDVEGIINDPHNPYWDAAELLLTNTSRTLYTTKSGSRIAFDAANITALDLALEAAVAPPPPPLAQSCDTPLPAVLPPGFTIDFPDLSGPPFEVQPGTKVKVHTCVPGKNEPGDRSGINKDYYAMVPVTLGVRDAISTWRRKKKDAGPGKCKDKMVNIGTNEGLVHVRLYDRGGKDPGDILAVSASICVNSGAVGPPPPPPADPTFLPYPNFPASGVDTLEELRVAIIDYVHGKDSFDQDGDTSLTDMRDVVLGDIFHSTPIVIGQPTLVHHGESGFDAFVDTYHGRDNIVYVGANDGMLHAFHAGDFHEDDPFTTGVDEGDDPNTPDHENGYYDEGTGEEIFGYIPGTLLETLKFIPRNSKPRNFYYVDGTPVAFDAWLGDGSDTDITKTTDEWATVLVTGLRDGGPGYFALDVTDPTAGSSDTHGPYPKLLWEFTHSKLADSTSEPVITRVKLRGASATGDHCGVADGDGDCREVWVAIFAGGYELSGDPNSATYVTDSTSANWKDESKAIFMVELNSGTLLASVEFDAAGVSGPAEMKYSIPSSPAALDSDGDGFADLVYVGDLGGQMWKWDISSIGEDADADNTIDNWPAGVFFRTDPTLLPDGTEHYRSFYFPPSAATVHNVLTITFGSGEREDLFYQGDSTVDDNNRFWAVQDVVPTGTGAFDSVRTEADLTDVTSLDTDTDLTDFGFFFVVEDGEKFITNSTIFAGQVIIASYTPEIGTDECVTAGGQAFLYVVDIDSAQGLFAQDSDPPSEDRRMLIGGGLPSNPRVSVGKNPEDDKVYIKTSGGKIITLEAPPRDDEPTDVIYWKQVF